MKQIRIFDALQQVLTLVEQIPVIASIVDRILNPKPRSKRALWDAFEDSCLKSILKPVDRLSLDKWYYGFGKLI